MSWCRLARQHRIGKRKVVTGRVRLRKNEGQHELVTLRVSYIGFNPIYISSIP